jgi:hypothetical protein
MCGRRMRSEWTLLKMVVNKTGRAETGVRTPGGVAQRLTSKCMGSSAKYLTSGTSEGVVSATSRTAEDQSGVEE